MCHCACVFFEGVQKKKSTGGGGGGTTSVHVTKTKHKQAREGKEGGGRK